MFYHMNPALFGFFKRDPPVAKATLLQSMGSRQLRPTIEALGAMLSGARRQGIWDVATWPRHRPVLGLLGG